ncbi:MAG TPA: adenylate kinase [bacterium]|nr:adenylate kinase [bacterium]HPS29782.1 adenylate kinase [bacterium]
MNIVIFGVPGAGKGTQCKLLSERLGLVHISTGDLIRSEIAEKSEIGIKAENIINSGKLLDDITVFEIFSKKLHNSLQKRGVLFDGFPRTLKQAEMLDDLLVSMNMKLDHFIELMLTENESVSRILKRASIEGRTDDNPETVKSRFQEYTLKTAPIAGYYRKKGIGFSINGTGTVEEVYNRIVLALKI